MARPGVARPTRRICISPTVSERASKRRPEWLISAGNSPVDGTLYKELEGRTSCCSGRAPCAISSPPPSRSEDTALALSVGGSVASLALVVVGSKVEGDAGANMVLVGLASSLVTPSLGEMYAGKFVTGGMVMRAAAIMRTKSSLIASTSLRPESGLLD